MKAKCMRCEKIHPEYQFEPGQISYLLYCENCGTQMHEPVSDLTALAKELAQQFVETETVDALLWKYDKAVIPGLRAGTFVIITARVYHADEEQQVHTNGAKLLEAVRSGK